MGIKFGSLPSKCISLILMDYDLMVWLSTIIFMRSLTVTVDVFKVVFCAWMASITILCKMDSFHWKNYNTKERKQNYYAVAIVTAGCADKIRVVGQRPISSKYI